MRIFEPDSPVMSALSAIADLVILNLVVLVCCIPVVTVGAALTGMHYVLLKMVRDEEGYIVRSYFRSFKENFLQATCIWLLFLAFGLLLVLDLRLTGSGAAGLQLPSVFRMLLAAGGIYIFLTGLYAFPLLARFHSTVAGTLRNAAVLAAGAFPRTLGMAAATVLLPLAVSLFTPLLPVLLLLGLTGPGFVCACLYSPLFKRIEEKSQEQ